MVVQEMTKGNQEFDNHSGLTFVHVQNLDQADKDVMGAKFEEWYSHSVEEDPAMEYSSRPMNGDKVDTATIKQVWKSIATSKISHYYAILNGPNEPIENTIGFAGFYVEKIPDGEGKKRGTTTVFIDNNPTGESFRGKGVGMRALFNLQKAAIDLSISDPDFIELRGLIHKGNEASIEMTKKMGFEFEKEYTEEDKARYRIEHPDQADRAEEFTNQVAYRWPIPQGDQEISSFLSLTEEKLKAPPNFGGFVTPEDLATFGADAARFASETPKASGDLPVVTADLDHPVRGQIYRALGYQQKAGDSDPGDTSGNNTQ